MPGHSIIQGVVFVFLLLAMAGVTAAPVIVENRATHAANLQAVKEHRETIDLFADRDDAAGLISMLVQVDGDSGIDPAIRDHLLEVTLLALSRTTPDLSARAAVRRYRSHPVTTFVRLHDEPGQPPVPLYDPAAAARLTIHAWDMAATAESVSEALRAGLWQPGDFMRADPDVSLEAWQSGTRRAFESVDRSFVAATKFALVESHHASVEYGPLLVAAASRLGDSELFEAVMAQGDARYAREAIGIVHRSLDFDVAARLLINASRRPELASAAILELGAHFSNARLIRSWLLNRLGDPDDGASAALALARATDDDILDAIGAIITGDAPRLTQLRATLVLRISESAAAQSLRRELLARTMLSEELREALR